LIHSGRVGLNGRVSRDPEKPVRLPHDRIEVDGVTLGKKSAVYLVMNKPRGVVTTASDEKGRATVYSLLDPSLPWVGPVGRLDKASEGLLLLTNDTEWAAQITAPSSHLDKKYHVQIDRVADAGLLAGIAREPSAAPGKLPELADLRAKSAQILRRGEKTTWLEITLDEGKNRQIRRLLEGLGVGVLRLVRVSIGSLSLGNLQKGAIRPLTAEEKESLDQSLSAVNSTRGR
jgi:23S rRNA pseudouridine2605 synthase